MWRPLAATLEQMAVTPLAIVVTPSAGREMLMAQANELATRTAEATARVAAARAPSLIVETVTGTVKGDNAFAEPTPRAARDSGRAWGSAVHRCVDAMVRGRTAESLRLFVRAVLSDEGVATSALDRMMQLLDTVSQSPAWKAIRASGVARSELSVMRAARVGDRVIVTEGVIDVAVDDGTQWRVIDWKSDYADDDAWAVRMQRYTDQVTGYASLLQEITGRPAAGSIERVGQS